MGILEAVWSTPPSISCSDEELTTSDTAHPTAGQVPCQEVSLRGTCSTWLGDTWVLCLLSEMAP